MWDVVGDAAATWPGVLNALCQCIVMEVAASKKRGPKPILAKTLRNLVHKAEDTSRSGAYQHVLQSSDYLPLLLCFACRILSH
jgi:hypothetical protein